MVALPRFNIGRLRVTAPKYPSEPGYVESMRAQMGELQKIYRKLFNGLEEATPAIMMRSLEPTFEKSKLYCPKDTLALVNSGYLEITGTGNRSRVECGFAKGGSPPYAVYVHEVTTYHHKTPTRSKWHQAAMMEDLGTIKSKLEADYKTVLDNV